MLQCSEFYRKRNQVPLKAFKPGGSIYCFRNVILKQQTIIRDQENNESVCDRDEG